jgi:hypothetical protein
VAPSIAVPPRFQTYEKLSATGDHTPGEAVRVCSTVVVPEIVGGGVVTKGPGATTAVLSLVFAVGVNPSFSAVTVTEMA